MMKTTSNNNTTTITSLAVASVIRAACEGSEGSEGIRRCVTTFYKKNYQNIKLDKVENKHKLSQNGSIITVNKNIENSKPHIEIPSQPSHPHICAQLSVRVFSVPSQPSQHSIPRIKNIFKTGTPFPLEPSLYSPIHLLGEKKTN